jgi:hypothetical protein
MKIKRDYAVRFKTELCDSKGRVIRELQTGRNMITDYGMNQLAALTLPTLITTLHVSSTTQNMKTVAAAGNSITIDDSTHGADYVYLETLNNFFTPTDAGSTLKIAGVPEMQLIDYTDPTHMVGIPRGEDWLPGYAPTAGPYSDFGIHRTEISTLGAQFATVATFDTSAANNNTEINDSANNRWIHQRVWLSAVLGGGGWTVNQLGWGTGVAGGNVFGKANLLTPDIIPAGNRYRVTLQVFSTVTPIAMAGVAVNWGATIGSYTLDMGTERIWSETAKGHFLEPFFPNAGNLRLYTLTSAPALQAVAYEGDAGFTQISTLGTNTLYVPAAGDVNGAYVNGEFKRMRRFLLPDTVAINAQCLAWILTTDPALSRPPFRVRSTAGNIVKPSGYFCDIVFPIHWDRELVN